MRNGQQHPLAAGLLEKCLESGSFKLRSGRQSLEKFDFELLTDSRSLCDRWLLYRTARALGSLVAETMPGCEMILSVANGANPLCRGVAREISQIHKHNPEVLARQTQKLDNGDFWVKGGNIHVRDRRIVVIDDVYTVGTNIGLVADAVERFGGIVVGSAVVLNRNEYGASTIARPGSDNPFIKVHSMIQYPIPTFRREY